MKYRSISLLALGLLALAAGPALACKDAVVLVHGNAGSPGDWSETYGELLASGYAAGEIQRPDWGSKTCAACNNHSGSEEEPVVDAIVEALAVSCSGKIDIIGHSMGATLAAKQVVDYGLADDVDAFVGVAGAFRGLWTCGTYPWNVWNSTCGYWGLSVGSPFLDWLDGKPLGNRVYSIKSWSDQVVCTTGVCTVGGVHSSRISGEDASYSFPYGHFGLQAYTAGFQVDLVD
ncbi:esterase/lipase family protein [Wenzhouxiangella sediminis]|uniref:Alpha/beta fold hydrolase n=1 Tax=Wenzhouxiangella sediminis TaxID=1792836 RepID=A0A3E1K5A2_9GAMM|nr:alpha/beta fold hydrolase [Wenzhouxiangella sediminis]RFF29213.1 alpha/beta fold hydrolase [Wenzhouxiangella sediminis]